MKVVSSDLISGKKVLLRYDLDVPLEQVKSEKAVPAGRQGKVKSRVTEDFRLKAGLPTLKLCLESANQVIVMGHIGRPDGKEVPELSVEPIYDWLAENGFRDELESGKLKLLENLRFESGEDNCSEEYAKELASYGNFYVNEAFSAYHSGASTTVLPTLLPNAFGLRFVKEVETLRTLRESPKKPFIAIMGGAKVSDKLPVIKVLAERADKVLVGGKLILEIKEEEIKLPDNVVVGKLNDDGFDITSETVLEWGDLIKDAATIVWNGPLGKFEDEKNDATKKFAEQVLMLNAEIIIGGGDIIAALSSAGLLEKAEQKAFVSVGGGAMLKLLEDGTLPTLDI